MTECHSADWSMVHEFGYLRGGDNLCACGAKLLVRKGSPTILDDMETVLLEPRPTDGTGA